MTILNALALTEARAQGACFDQTLTLGRLACYLSLSDSRRIARVLPPDSTFVKSAAAGKVAPFVDDFLFALGARSVDSMDANSFEGATVSHDLNEPLPAHLLQKYDAVVDGGTLEHVFNVPVAFRNAMDALRVGGRFFATVPANNFCGHGFYQFSAEFFYRVFSRENGFEMRQVLVAPARAAGWLDGPAFEVDDPENLKRRIEISGRRPMVLLVHAQKVEQKVVFAQWPQQSDFAAAWSSGVHRPGISASRNRGVSRPIFEKFGLLRYVYRLKERRIWSRQCVKTHGLKHHKWTL